ncbi:MAG: PocR ligand-binding domain-containing protein [Oscillospiraceae bacterium]|nr:PocR ligand-binding domain-containing protein [Oscillospiraceae bacterium]
MNDNYPSDKDLELTKLIDVITLQQIQDAFSDMTGMAALTTDSTGRAVTNGSNFTDFCMRYTRQSQLGCSRCAECDRHGAELTLEGGKACSYFCHAGLVDFAAPIMANGQMIGSFIGGQVLTVPPNFEKFRRIAAELGIDPEEYVKAVKKVPVVSKESVDKAAKSLCVIANVLSDIAYKSHTLYESNREIEKASNMKSDFLANMSHEIRTPMNAVLGMVDLALREEMSPAARGFLNQIKVSSKNLLVIINDILDFSKIESGKMEIICENYEFYSVISDIANIINNRIANKDIEFTLDISPDIPKKLYGDNSRLHQILINLLNNAVKFTHHGEVHLKVSGEVKDEDEIILKIEVRDTGIGIKNQDMKMLFNSFQQVDSKRNRNVEGTGLGLAICHQLLGLMGGNIRVESEYEKGTTFFVELPQKIVNTMPEFPLPDKKLMVAVRSDNEYFKRQLSIDLDRIGAEFVDFDFDDSLADLRPDYLIVEQSLIPEAQIDYINSHKDMTCIAVTDYASQSAVMLPNQKVIKKPVFAMALYNAMGISNINLNDAASEADAFTFTAPDAHILIVDDNSINLAVAKGLLEPLKMQVDTASSAAEAIEKLKQDMYDLIFMDHMMPEVDGVEATRIIRRLMPDYNGVPIIALTANAVSGAKEMFLEEGMDDFVAKPIEIKEITAKLRKWLPTKKIIHDTTSKTEQKETVLNIPGLETEQAVQRLGSSALYMTVLKEYYKAISVKSEVIENHFYAERWRDYTIEVHSLKSTSRQIGATALAELAAELEKAGNEGNIALIKEKTEDMLRQYYSMKALLSPIFPEEEEKKGRRSADKDDITRLLDKMQEALDNFDSLMIDEVIEEMSGFDYSDEQKNCFDSLKQAAEISDIDSCAETVNKWREMVG